MSNASRVPTLDAPAVRRVAVAGGCHPDTVRRLLAGRPVTATTRDRVHDAIAKLGLEKSASADNDGNGGGEAA